MAFSGADKPGTDQSQPFNSYRFNAKRWESASGNYDMGFRDYSPSQNRFLSLDLYNGALDDLGLTTDPFTNNRYAFGGGNPLSNIEIDGHIALIDDLAEAAVVLVVVAAVVTYEVVVNDEDVQTALGDTIDSIFEGIHDLVSDDDPEPEPTRRPPGDPGPVQRDNKKRCESEPKSSRFQYQPLDGQKRAQGATALICPSDLKGPNAGRSDSGTVNVHGFPNGPQNTNGRGGNIYDRTHIVGDKVGGDWTDENLFTGFSRMNKSGMRRCETKMEKQLAAGKWVQYSAKLNYSHATGIPDSITMSAYTEDGALFKNVVVLNNSDWQTTC